MSDTSTDAMEHCPRCQVERAKLQAGQWCPACGFNPQYEQQLAAVRKELEAVGNLSLCAACGWSISRNEPDWRKQLTEHILNCEPHPLTQLKKSLVDVFVRLEAGLGRIEREHECGGIGSCGVCEALMEIVELKLPGEDGHGHDGLHGPDGQPKRPTIVCLCGSTRFWKEFQRQSLKETLAGKIVLSIGAASGTDDEHFGNLPRAEYDRVKLMLDELHKRKIDLADEILVLNVGDYIGESTRSEIEYAAQHGKRVRYLFENFTQPQQPAAPASGPDGQKDGAALIAEERRRQITEEGWTKEHDEQHTHGQLAQAAVAYILEEPDRYWPTGWSRKWWKPSPGGYVRNLTKAGALLAAEIDRLQELTVQARPRPAGAPTT